MHASKEQMGLALNDLLGQRLLKVPAKLPYADVFKRALLSDEAHISASGHTRYGAPAGEHDNITSAVSLAITWDQAQRRPKADVWGA